MNVDAPLAHNILHMGGLSTSIYSTLLFLCWSYSAQQIGLFLISETCYMQVSIVVPFSARIRDNPTMWWRIRGPHASHAPP